MRVATLFTVFFGLGVRSQEVVPEAFDTGEGLNLLQLRSSKKSAEHGEKARGLELVSENSRCRQEPSKRATFDSKADCAAAWAGEVTYIGWWKRAQANPARLRGLCLGWTEADCTSRSIARGYKNKLFKCSDDEAAAVGDPHLTLSSGAKTDMCCEGGDCKACDLSDVDALLQEDAQGLELVSENSRCRQEPSKRATFDSKADCAAAWAGEVTYIGFWKRTQANPARLRGLCLGWTEADCTSRSIARGYKNKLFKCSDDEAAAVGDPHLTLSSGANTDMCCEGGDCKACDLSDVDALLQEDA